MVKRVAVAALALAFAAGARAQEFGPISTADVRPTFGVLAAETGAGLAGGLAGAAATAGVAWLCLGGNYLGGGSGVSSGGGELLGWLVTGAAGAVMVPGGIGIGTQLAGDALCPGGTRGAAIAGSYVGILAGFLVGGVAASIAELLPRAAGPVDAVGFGIALLMPAAGATVGYNISRNSVGGEFGSGPGRFGLPAVAVSTTRAPDGSVATVLGLRAVTVRF